jgi:hypothetical protein
MPMRRQVYSVFWIGYYSRGGPLRELDDKVNYLYLNKKYIFDVAAVFRLEIL